MGCFEAHQTVTNADEKKNHLFAATTGPSNAYIKVQWNF